LVVVWPAPRREAVLAAPRSLQTVAACVLLAACPACAGAQRAELPEPLLQFLHEIHLLPRYQERYYHPIGRNPAVDAVLGDPVYFPTYAREVSRALRRAASAGKLEPVLAQSLLAGACPTHAGSAPEPEPVSLPGAAEVLGKDATEVIERAWGRFLAARRIAEEALAPLSPEERAWLREHREAYFFGEHGGDEYAFFTTESSAPLKVFALAAKIDLVRLAAAGRALAVAADEILVREQLLRSVASDGIVLTYVKDGAVLRIAGQQDDRHIDAADMLIDLGGNDIYLNNAGGTAGVRPAALLVDLAGDDRYETTFATQGAGFLGVGLLVDLAGDDRYSATDFCQGAGWFGCGQLCDRSGNDEYHAGFFAQAAAGFGFALLWDRDGNDHYQAVGMAQAASTTQGAAFLIDSAGDDDYRCGGSRELFWTRPLGVGQGAAVGVRVTPVRTSPTFYGGLAFLDDGGGNDHMYCATFGQGSGYCFGIGVLVNTGGDDQFVAGLNSQGAGLHLAAGLLLKQGGDDFYDCDEGSGGVGADRGVGILIDTGGNDRYRGTTHNFGSARKPKALGMFVDVAGDDSYAFNGESCGRVQRPESPEDWPRALFADLSGQDVYPADERLSRVDGAIWCFEQHGVGVDGRMDGAWAEECLFAAFPERPRTPLPFDPLSGWPSNVAYRALLPPGMQGESTPAPGSATSAHATPVGETPSTATAPRPALMWALPEADYDRRRQTYERLDLLRFTTGEHFDRSVMARLLDDSARVPEDQLAYAAVWSEVDGLREAAERVLPALAQNQISSVYARRLLIRMVGEVGGDRVMPVLSTELCEDSDALCRAEAARALARVGKNAAPDVLWTAAGDPSNVVRCALCAGLRDTRRDGALDVVRPLLSDADLYVRREAAIAAISLGYKPAIGILLESMRVATLDTTENYGQNLFVTLSSYVGEDLGRELGLNLDNWFCWWREHGDTFDLEAALRARPPR
jgi:hypothetical protein